MSKNNKHNHWSLDFVLLTPVFVPYEDYLAVNYTELIPHLINKIHTQDKRINELENKLNQLLGMIH